jgi:hypothetical protein
LKVPGSECWGLLFFTVHINIVPVVSGRDFFVSEKSLFRNEIKGQHCGPNFNTIFMANKTVKKSTTQNNEVKKKKFPKLSLDEQISENNSENDRERKLKLLNLIAEIIVEATLRDLYETSN